MVMIFFCLEKSLIVLCFFDRCIHCVYTRVNLCYLRYIHMNNSFNAEGELVNDQYNDKISRRAFLGALA